MKRLCWISLLTMFILLLGIVTVSATMRITTIDGRTYDVSISRNQLKSIEFIDSGETEAPSVQKIFNAVPNQSSSAFKANIYPAVRMETASWDKTPYHMATPFAGQIVVAPEQRVFLAGNAAGTDNWGIDNFLLLEFTTNQGTQCFVIGSNDPVYYHNQRVTQVGPNASSQAPNAVDFAQYLPKNTTIKVKISALDYGGVGGVSNIYLIVR